MPCREWRYYPMRHADYYCRHAIGLRRCHHAMPVLMRAIRADVAAMPIMLRSIADPDVVADNHAMMAGAL